MRMSIGGVCLEKDRFTFSVPYLRQTRVYSPPSNVYIIMRKWIYDWTNGDLGICALLAMLLIVAFGGVVAFIGLLVCEPKAGFSILGFIAAIAGIAWILKLAGKP